MNLNAVFLQAKASVEVPAPKTKFRAQFKHGMLTYSCPVNALDNPITEREQIRDALRGLTHYAASVVGRELHENGKTHYHAYVMFNPKCDSTNPRVFDVMGVHPNIKHGHQGWQDMVAYVTKQDTDALCDNFVRSSLLTAKQQRAADDAVRSHAMSLAKQGKLKEAQEHWMENAEKDWMSNFQNNVKVLEHAAQHYAGNRRQKPVHENWITEHQHIDLNEILPGENYKRTHVLVGPAGIGKTQLAKYLLKKAGCTNAVVVRNHEQLNSHPFADGIVFDELSVNVPGQGFWEREQQVAVVDQDEDSVLRARYKNANLHWDTLRIITTNVLTRALMVEDEAVARRITVHELTTKLFE